MKKNNRAARAARFLLQCFDVAKRRREIFILGSLKKYFHRGYPYAALIMCTSDCGSGCFKALWCILSLIVGASD